MIQKVLGFVNENANAISALGTITSAFAAIVALYIAWTSARLSKKLLDENKLMRLAGSDPEVIVYLQPSERSANVLSLIIENVGSGPAFDVQLKTNLDQNVLKSKNAFFRVNFGEIPITAITQNSKISTLFGQGFNLLGDEPLDPFICIISYHSLRKEKYIREFNIDVGQFMHMGRLRDDPIADAANSLEKISRSLQSITEFDHLKVVYFSPTEHEKNVYEMRDETKEDKKSTDELNEVENSTYHNLASQWLRKFKINR